MPSQDDQAAGARGARGARGREEGEEGWQGQITPLHLATPFLRSLSFGVYSSKLDWAWKGVGICCLYSVMLGGPPPPAPLASLFCGRRTSHVEVNLTLSFFVATANMKFLRAWCGGAAREASYHK